MQDYFNRHKKTIEIVTQINAVKFQKEFFLRVKEKLKDSYVTEIHQQNDEIFFRAPIGRFSWNAWNIFNPITKGSIQLQIKKQIPILTYEVYFYEFFVIALLFSVTSLSAYFLDLGNFAVGILLIVWGLFFFGTKIITALRLQSFFKKMRIQINDPEIIFVPYQELFKDDINFIDEVFIHNDNSLNNTEHI